MAVFPTIRVPGVDATRRSDRQFVPRIAMLALAGVALWRSVTVGANSAASSSFVGSLHGGAPRPVRDAVARRARKKRAKGYAFGFVKSKEHSGLVIEDCDTGKLVKTEGAFMQGNWNTVLGNKELPSSGRVYWEVKIASKPSDAWEYIGVAEPSTDVTVPLTRNRKGAGWFLGANWRESCIYRFFEPDTKKFQAEQKKLVEICMPRAGLADDKYIKPVRVLHNRVFKRKPRKNEEFLNKEVDKDYEARVKELSEEAWSANTHVGAEPDLLPPLKSGTVVGIDVDMDEGSMSFWANGKFYGPVRDHTGRPVNLKGKKLVPAISVFGMTTGGAKYSTQMEVRTGLAPPERP